MLKNPYVQAIFGGLGSALAVAAPLVDDGVKPSEAIAVVAAFLTGSGLYSAVMPSRREPSPADDPALPVEGE